MKRSQLLLKLQRFYTQKHVMVEQGYIDKNEFMDQVLQLAEDLGMMPPFSDKIYGKVWRDGGSGYEWEKE